MSEKLAPEAAEAIRIADKHLPGAPPEQRLALAKDIMKAIGEQAKVMIDELFDDINKRLTN